MRRNEIRGVLAGVSALILLLATDAGAPRALAAEDQPLRLTATAVNLSGVGRARMERLDIVIERWTSDEQRAQLIETLIEQGSDKLYDAVQKIKPRAGFIKTTTSLGWDIQYARETPLPDGGRRIVFVTDRPMSFYEVSRSTRSSDYDFMVCEIHLDAAGKGEGKLAGGTKIRWNKEEHSIVLENYGIEPVRLTQVNVSK